MKSSYTVYFILVLTFKTGFIYSQADPSFSVKWENLPWASGGEIPAGPPWSMVGPYDFDGDNFGDFIVSSAYAGAYCNGVYHYEAAGNDSIDLRWVYTFYELNCADDAYSSVAVGDIDGDGNQEILALVDTSPGVTGQDALQIFEWNPDSMSFLSEPTYTWDMGLEAVWEAGQILVEDVDGDGNQEIIVSIMNGPSWADMSTGGSSQLIIFEFQSATDGQALFNIEYEDNIWTNWSGYNISTGDLDGDGFIEIYTVAYEYYRLIIYESTGEDSYDYQTDFYISSEQYQRANQGIVVYDINNDGQSELFCATSGVNSLEGDIFYTPGSFYIASGVEDIANFSFANFNLVASYEGGLRQIAIGDADSDGSLNVYIAGHYNEALYDWEYNGGDPNLPDSYLENIVYIDNLEDNFTTEGTALDQDQGKVRVAKLFSGDIDYDGQGDIIFTSASFAIDKPHIFMLEHNSQLYIDENSPLPRSVHFDKSYPNPFNGSTKISYTLKQPDDISITIYDLFGAEVAQLFKGFQINGTHSLQWDGSSDKKKPVASGIYFCEIKNNTEVITKKMIYCK